MTPVAGCISNAYKYGLVLLPCFSQSFLSPWIPIHRVMGVLEEVGAGFSEKIIGHFYVKRLKFKAFEV
jgi:hypothetical protein